MASATRCGSSLPTQTEYHFAIEASHQTAPRVAARRDPPKERTHAQTAAAAAIVATSVSA